MAKLARIVVPDVPHHFTQRGDRRPEIFFGEEDYAACRTLIAESCAREGKGLEALTGRVPTLRKPGPRPKRN
jgi:putative transposase